MKAKKSAPKSRSIQIQPIHSRSISPCALGWTLGIIHGACFFLYVGFAASQTNLLWYNPATFDIVVRFIPEWIPISYLGAVVAGIYGAIIGAFTGLLIGWIYNWRVHACNCRWCV